MSDNVAEVQIRADASGAQAGMQQASAAVRQGVDQIKGHLGGLSSAFGMVATAMAGIGAVLAGGSAFKAAVDETVNLTKESVALGKQFGISATDASILKVALDDVFVSQEKLQMAGNRVTQALRTNEQAFRGLGVQTRDANGHLLATFDIMQAVNKRLLEFKEGTDRNIEGQKIYGRAWSEVSATLKLTEKAMEDAKEKAEALGLVVGQESVDSTKNYRSAMNDVNDVFMAVKKAIGDAVLPALTEMGKWFASIGPQVVQVMRVALDLLSVAFTGVINVISQLWGVVKAVFGVIGELIGGAVGDGSDSMTALVFFKRTVQGIEIVFLGLEAVVKTVVEAVVGALQWMMDGLVMVASAISGFQSGGLQGMKDAWTQAGAVMDQNSATHAKNITGYWEEAGKKIEEVASRDVNAFGKPGKVTPTAKGGGGAASAGDESAAKAAAELNNKWFAQTSKMLLSETEKLAREEAKIQADATKTKRDLQLIEVDDRKNALHAQFQAGEITKAQELQSLKGLESDRYAIEQEALTERLGNAAIFSAEEAAIRNEQEIAEKQHNVKLAQLDRESALERSKSWRDAFKTMEGGFQNVIQQFMKGQLSIKGLFQGMVSAVVDAMTSMVAKVIAQWAVAKIASLIFKKSEMAGDVARAGAGGVASMAAAPFPLNLSAPAFGASMAALAAGYLAVPAASAGFDIPAGVNPLTQLHQREMVLPAKYADTIRDMADSGGGGGGGHTFNITIPAIDGASTKAWLRNGGDRQIAEAMRRHLKV